MDYGEKLQPTDRKPTLETKEVGSHLAPLESLENWAPERNSQLIGNKVIASSDGPAASNESLQNVATLGQIVATSPDVPSREAAPIDAGKIYPSGHEISRETIDTLKAYEQKLAMDGNMSSFYDEICSAREIYQSKSGENYAR